MFGESASHPAALPPDTPRGSLDLPTLSKYHPPIEPMYLSTRGVRPAVLLLGLDMIHGFELHAQDALHLYPATLCAHRATVNAISPVALETVLSPQAGPIQRSEGLLHGIPLRLGIAFEHTLRMSVDLDWDVGCALLRYKVVVMGEENTL